MTKNLDERLEAITDERTLRLFACDCAERGLSYYPIDADDPRPRQAVEVARRFARGDAKEEELVAARDAALDAAGDAAEIASWAAAEPLTIDVALAILWTARVAARASARGVEWGSAEIAAQVRAGVAIGDANEIAELGWQHERLTEYLEGKTDAPT